jgi:hypothetical protein
MISSGKPLTCARLCGGMWKSPERMLGSVLVKASDLDQCASREQSEAIVLGAG